MPHTLIGALIERAPRNLTIVSNNAGNAIRRRSNPIVIGLVSGLVWSFTALGIWEPMDRMTAMLSAAVSPTALITGRGTGPKLAATRQRAAGSNDGGPPQTRAPPPDRLVPVGQGGWAVTRGGCRDECHCRVARRGHCVLASPSPLMLSSDCGSGSQNVGGVLSLPV
jgi:hypothetical protein